MNATKKVKLVISVTDVKRGATKDPAACAAALACKRQMHSTEARVHIARTYVKVDDKWLRFRTSDALRNEIIAFDRGGTFEPGEYELEVVPPSDRNKRSKSHKKNTVRVAKRSYHTVVGVRPSGTNK